MTDPLDALIQTCPQVWRGKHTGSAVDALPTGFVDLDQALPHKGWPWGSVIELLAPVMGIGEVRLLLPAIVQVTRDRRYVLMIDTPYQPYAPALTSAGVDLEHLLIVSPKSRRDALWSAEKALANQACGMVLLWHDPRRKGRRDNSDPQAVRRLQVAAQAGKSLLFLYPRCEPNPAAALRQHSWAAIRLLLSAAGNHLAVKILKAKGGYQRPRILVNLQGIEETGRPDSQSGREAS